MRELVAVAFVLGTACGGGQRAQVAREARRFDCRSRVASYVVAQHLSGAELGVQIDCAQVGPRIQRWLVDKTGTRLEDARSMTPVEFDAIWAEIDGTGWPNLRDCANGTAGKQDPIYMFDIKDELNRSSFQCQSQSMPYPYNGIVDPLDLAAQQGRRQLQPDEPGDPGERKAAGARPARGSTPGAGARR